MQSRRKSDTITHPVNTNPSMTPQKESGKEGLKILLMLASVIVITAGLQAAEDPLAHGAEQAGDFVQSARRGAAVDLGDFDDDARFQRLRRPVNGLGQAGGVTLSAARPRPPARHPHLRSAPVAAPSGARPRTAA